MPYFTDLFHLNKLSTLYSAHALAATVVQRAISSSPELESSVSNTNQLEALARRAEVLSKQIAKFYDFPSIVDNYGAYGKRLLLQGGDGTYKLCIMIEGAYGGKEGAFEYIIEDEEITHRFFRSL